MTRTDRILDACKAMLDPGFPTGLAREVRLLVLDVDGVLTDGGLYFNETGLVFKRFDVQDGLGVKLAQEAGLKVAIITGMHSPEAASRASALGITEFHSGVLDKNKCLDEILQRHALEWSAVAYVGDDWLDLCPLSRAGLALSVANAQPEAKAAAHYVSKYSGGHGAVRDFIRHILAAQDRLEPLVRSFAEGRK